MKIEKVVSERERRRGSQKEMQIENEESEKYEGRKGGVVLRGGRYKRKGKSQGSVDRKGEGRKVSRNKKERRADGKVDRKEGEVREGD